MSKGIRIYTVMADLKADEMISPKLFAKHDTENNVIQNGTVIPFISRMSPPMITKESV